MSSLLPVAVVVCPIAMGLMMLLMWKGVKGGGKREDVSDDRSPAGELPSLADLKAEQARLTEAIELLERERREPAVETAGAR